MPNPILKQAVVIGAGMGGLAAAKAVAPHFEKVIVFERDALPDAPAPRPGTPQARHTHGLLAGGHRALERLFPGIELDLVEAGAVRIRMSRDVRYEIPGFDPFPQRDFGCNNFGMSRPALERICRRRVERAPNIEFRPRSRVTEVIATPDNRGVAGCASKTRRPEPREVSPRPWSSTPRGERRQRYASSRRPARRSRRRSRSASIRPMRRPSSRTRRTLRRIGSWRCTRLLRRAAAAMGSSCRSRGDDGAFRFA
jgi:hypothetical protein